MINTLLYRATKTLSNSIGWRTNRHIVVIESDDWGSIRMPSTRIFEYLTSKGIDLTSGGAERYNRNDTLATKDDLIALFEVLNSVQDVYGNNPALTAVCVVANPDFKKIKESDFQQYFYEPFTETLKRYPNCSESFQLWNQGISHKIFKPQFHGREHLNVAVWLRALQSKDVQARLAFDCECWGFNNKHPLNVSYQSAFDLETKADIPNQVEILDDGLNLFEQLFGYKASFFVPPNGPINSSVEQASYNKGVRYISTGKIHREALGNGKTRLRFRYLGKRDKTGLTFTTRNCFFEPSDQTKDWVSSCLEEISLAFSCSKPAIISSHRVNYIGGINEKNRKAGLTQLKELLTVIKKNWPRVEFMTSDELGKIMSI